MRQIEIDEKFHTELDIIKYFEQVRWGKELECAYCGSKNLSKRLKDLRFKCYYCKRTTSVTIGTFLHGTNVKLSTWLKVFSFISSAEKGITAEQLKSATQIGTYSTARKVFNKTRDMLYPEFQDGVIMASIQEKIPTWKLKRAFKYLKDKVPQAIRIKSKRIPILDITKPQHDIRFSKIMKYLKPDYFHLWLNGVPYELTDSLWLMINRQIRIQNNPIELKYLDKYIYEVMFEINPKKGIDMFEALARNSMKETNWTKTKRIKMPKWPKKRRVRYDD